MKIRCDWVGTDPDMIKYHDTEWGTKTYNDKLLFEFLILEGAQAGLSWKTILKRREGYRKAFSNYDIGKIARYTENDIQRLLTDSGIIRNQRKIETTITNARAFLAVQKEFGTFSKYIWQFVDNKVIDNKIVELKDIPVTSEQSNRMSKDLLKRGFKFVGPTICYAYMQAIGMVNDHQIKCFRYTGVI